MEMKKKFRDFILNDIFYFDKSELNFGIYKIFRQKQKLIEDLIDEIINEVENELSTDKNMKEIKKVLEDELPGKIFKKIDFENINIEELKKEIKDYVNEDFLERLDNEKYSPTKIYEYLYQFFHLYYETGDFGYTNRSFNVYKIPFKERKICEDSQEIGYNGEETLFTWKTKDSYYIKSNKFLNTLNLKLKFDDKEYNIKADVIGKDEIKDDKKVKQYRLISITKIENEIYLKFNLSDTPTPKHTIYLLILTLIHSNIDEINYDDFDNELKQFFENISLKEKITSSLFDNSKEIIEQYKKAYKKYEKYLINNNKNIFIFKLGGKENEQQIKSKISKLMINKNDYANKVYNVPEAKKYLDVKKFDFYDKNNIAKLYEKDKLLDFFYRLDRGINLFFAGVDSDYFIHKNLKRFLLIELDKFIKNYIFADTDAILDMKDTTIFKFAKIFKKEAIKIIELLDSIEEFQKYIWEKRKLIKQTHYIISSNKITDIKILEEVLKNNKQTDEWIKLDLTKEIPNLLELQSYPYPIDTKYFNDEFKYKVLSQFDNLDEEIDGILIKSENFQALKFLEPKFKEQIKCIYIDPPYNTGNDGFIYKDNYQEASWLSMMNDRLNLAKELLKDDGVISSSIDDRESYNLYHLLKNYFIVLDRIALQVKAQSGDSSKLNKPFIDLKEDIYFASNTENYTFENIKIVKEYIDKNSKTINQYNYLLKNLGVKDKKSFSFEIDKGKTKIDVYEIKNFEWERIPKKNKTEEFYLNNIDNIVRTAAFSGEFKKQFSDKKDKVYYFEYEITRGKNKGKKAEIYIVNGEQLIFLKNVSKIIEEKGKKRLVKLEQLSNIWTDISYTGIAKEGRVELKNGKKPEKLLERIVKLSIPEESREWVLDFFAGSGTTPAVAYKMNKKFIGIEMNDYFESLILKRMKYTMFGNSGGIESKKEKGLIQYIYLEQYDDIIDNLKTKDEVEKLKVEAKYIYNPDKNKIDFRIEDDIKNPFKGNFDIFHSFIYHKGFKLKKVIFEDEVLVGELNDNKVLILGKNEDKVIKAIKKYENKDIYTNIKYPNTNEINVYTFKGI